MENENEEWDPVAEEISFLHSESMIIQMYAGILMGIVDLMESGDVTDDQLFEHRKIVRKVEEAVGELQVALFGEEEED